MNIFRAFVALFALSASAAVSADLEFYAGGSFGNANADAKSSPVLNGLTAKGYTINQVAVDSEDTGWRFVTGLRFTEIFGVELGFVDLGEAKTTIDATISPTQEAQFNRDVADALPVMPRGMTLAGVARFRLPSNERVSFAAKLGVIDADSERVTNGARGSSSVNADPYYGAVLGWEFNDSWRGVLGVEIFNMADSTDYWSAGVEFKFPSYSR